MYTIQDYDGTVLAVVYKARGGHRYNDGEVESQDHDSEDEAVDEALLHLRETYTELIAVAERRVAALNEVITQRKRQ